MKRFNRMIIFIIVIIMILNIVNTVINAQGNVSYEGQANGFVFKPGSNKSVTDLFENFKEIMPGDKLTDQVEVNNKSSKQVKIYMKALGAESGSERFLNQMGLQVEEGGNILFDSAADKTAQLTDWVLLGTFNPNDVKKLDITLSIPIEMNDDFQDAIGYLSWKFKVEELDPPTTPTPTPTPSVIPTPTPTAPSTKPPFSPPNTRDETNLGVYGLAFMSSILIFGYILISKIRGKEL